MKTTRDSTTDFQKAVKFSKKSLDGKLHDPNLEKLSDQILERIGLIGFEPSPFQKEYLDSLIEHAESEAISRQALCLGIARATEEQLDLPLPAKIWLARFLRQELGDVKPSKGRPTNRGLQVAIFHTVQDLVDYHGMRPTRGESSESTSACDAVAEALKQLGKLPTSYDRVRKIWGGKLGLRIYLDEE